MKTQTRFSYVMLSILVTGVMVSFLLPKLVLAAASYVEYISLCSQRDKIGCAQSDSTWRKIYPTEAERVAIIDTLKKEVDAKKKAAADRVKPAKPADCSSTTGYWTNLPVCIVRASLAGIGSFFMWFGVKAVVLAGGLFELMLDYGIIKFGAMLKNIESGINDGWTALRDIANIIIIGLFVFIAVNIILGVKDFGDKKRVAHVLIVAVLINFSLLFTKVIIDASNFTAYQFYNSMAKKERVG